MFSVEEKIEHLKKLGFTGDLTEVEKMYAGEKFNPQDPNYQKLIKMSQDLCDEFSQLSAKLNNESEIVRNVAKRRKAEILDILFPGHGPIFGGRDGLSTVIGMVNIVGFTYLNGPVTFNPSSVVNLGYYSWGGSQFTVFGGELKLDENGMAKTSTINIEDDTVVYAYSKIEDGVTVPKRCVVGMGSCVTKQSKMKPDTIIVSKREENKVLPACSIKGIAKGYKSDSIDLPFKRSKKEVQEIVEFVKTLGIDGDFTEFKKSLNNEVYNCLDPVTSQIFDLTHNLCSEYNYGNPTPERKQEIIDTLFFKHGKNFKIGDYIIVDILGQVEVGDNVTIGNNVALNGNICIGDNVTIDDNVMLQSIGHPVYYEDRRLPESGPLNVANTEAGIYVCDNLKLAKGTRVGPNTRVDHNTEENELISRSKIVTEFGDEIYITL